MSDLNVRRSFLKMELPNITKFLSEFSYSDPSIKPSIELDRDFKCVTIRNFPLPDSFRPDYEDIRIHINDYPNQAPIGVSVHNDSPNLVPIFLALGGQVLEERMGMHGDWRFIGLKYNGGQWDFNMGNIMAADNLYNFIESFSDALSSSINEQFMPAECNEILKKLDNLVGLEEVKNKVRGFLAGIPIDKMKQEEGLPIPPVSYHLVFTGNPGTGKSTVARILAEIYKGMGILSKGTLKEAGRSDLVAAHIGETAIKTKGVIDEAKGGILFIDEAYSLTVNRGAGDFGFEAVDTLVQEMENNRDDLIVIVAGYPAEMQEFLKSNPGLPSRFTKAIEFPDYKPEEMMEIFARLCGKHGHSLTEDAAAFAKTHFEKIYKLQTKNFGNARDVRQFFEDSLGRLKNRLAQDRGLNTAPDRKRKLSTFEIEDLMTENELKEYKNPQTIEQILSELYGRVGLTEVKTKIRELAAGVKFQKDREKKGFPADIQGVHFVFYGNPGTGKTMVARMLGRLFYKMGLLPTYDVVETDRSGLIAGYIGQTAPLVNDMCDRAMGGILFIDEAYSLTESDSKNDFGKEAVATLLKRMEDDRGKFVVIVAGYTEDGKRFLRSNRGFRDRFTHFINFTDYSPDELYAIFEGMVKEGHFELTGEACAAARKEIRTMYDRREDDFANARTIRNLYDGIIRRMGLRMPPNPSRDELTRIIAEDIGAD
jgi:SpoVK/Ycf46/Vps4 family AAA+-type ATPase